jgi:eukaryotic-like serine/threonine-protein kinase
MPVLAPGTVIASKYRLDRPLARGGMGSVWVGRHLQLDVAVAVKFMDASFASSAEALGRFEREAKACARLKSPNIIQVHDYGVEDGTPYIVMELLEGEDLGARLNHVGRIHPAVAVPIAVQIAKALRSAHEAGIIHRDLKPGNVFLCRHQDEEIVKVLDFGIAKSVGDAQVGESTATGMVMGSPHYMSPEQARALKEIDARTDLWALGVILYRCVTGRLPFPGTQISGVLVSICMDPIPPPSQLVPGLGLEVDAFFARALARDPAYRFQSARELAEAFSVVAGVTPRPFTTSADLMVTAGTAPAVTSQAAGTAPLQPSRGPLLVLAIVVGALALMTGAVVLVLQLRRPQSPPPSPAAIVEAPMPSAAAIPPEVAAPPTVQPQPSALPLSAMATASAQAPHAKPPAAAAAHASASPSTPSWAGPRH